MTLRKREIVSGEFKTKCLALLDEVSERREEIVITKRGTPVARLAQLMTLPRRSLAVWLVLARSRETL
jgi:antitoxin (DNA-binding transcriptional repressor) of toxin-antitoxin stability system